MVTSRDIIRGKKNYIPSYLIPLPGYQKGLDFEYYNVNCIAFAHITKSIHEVHQGKIVFISHLEVLNNKILSSLDFNGYNPHYMYIFDNVDSIEMLDDINTNLIPFKI